MAAAQTTEESSKWNRRFSNIVGYGTVAATVLMLFFFLVLPVFVVVKKAFFGADGFTLQYFSLLFANDLQMESIYNSIWIGVATTIICTILCLPLSYIGAKLEFPGKKLLTGLLLVPMVMPPFVGAIGIQRFFARRGSVNLTLMEWGIIDTPIEWLSDERMFWAVVLLEVLHLYPILYLNLTAALSNVDPSVEEMAQVMGVPKWKTFKDIVWPLARPGYFAGATIVFIWALTDLGTPLLVGYHETMPVRIFNLVTDLNENPVGFALVFIVILMTIAFFLLSKLALGKNKYEMMAKGQVTSGVKSASKFSLPFIYAAIIGTVAVALVPHISVLITSVSDKWFMTPLPEYYTLKHFGAVFSQDLAFISIKNSFFFASMATLVDLVLGVMVAYVVVRKLIPGAAFLDALVMVPLALPGIVLAFGYVITYSDTILDPVVNPTILLIIAYGIRRLPYMVRSATAGLQQINRSLEEASMVFGASRFFTLRKITLPLISANLIAGSLLCFAYAMLDVSDSLILAMKDQFYPITKAIYVLFLEQGSGEFVASALGMISMGILTACILGSSIIMGKKMGEMFRG